MEQEVAHSGGGCNLRRALQVSGEMTLMLHIYIEDHSPVMGFRLVSGAPKWMDSLSGAPEWMYP